MKCCENVKVTSEVSHKPEIEVLSLQDIPEDIWSEIELKNNVCNFEEVLGIKLSSNESLHIYTYNKLGALQNEELYWLIEGRIALGRILIQLLIEYKSDKLHNLFNITIGELMNHMELHSQFLMAAYLSIIMGFGHKLMGSTDRIASLVIYIDSLLKWVGLIDQSEFTSSIIDWLSSLSLKLNHDLPKNELVKIFEELFRFNWIVLITAFPELLPPPIPPMESISISKDTLTLFGMDTQSARNTSILLGTFISALSELIKELYDETERLEDVWFETGRILNFHNGDYSFTLLSRTNQKVQDMRLIIFATTIIRVFETVSDHFIGGDLDNLLKSYSYHFFGLGDGSKTNKESVEIKWEGEPYASEIGTNLPDIIIFDDTSRYSLLSKLPYVSTRILICTSPDEIDPSTYLNYNLILYPQENPKIKQFAEAISFLNPKIRLKKIDNPRNLTKDFVLRLIWRANKAKREKVSWMLLDGEECWLNNRVSAWFSTNLASYQQQLNFFFLEIMNSDISHLLKEKVVRELVSVINYYFNIIRLSLDRLDEVGLEKPEFSLIHDRIVEAIQLLETIAVRYGQKFLHTYVLFIKGIYHLRIGENDIGTANLKGCRDLIKWHVLNGKNYDVIQVMNFFLKDDYLIKMKFLNHVQSLIQKSIEDLLIFSPSLFGVEDQEKTATLFIKYQDSLVFQSSIGGENQELISILIDHFLSSISSLVAEIRNYPEEPNAIFFRDSVIFVENFGDYKIMLFSTPRQKIDQLFFQTFMASIGELLEAGLEHGQLKREKEVNDLFHSLY